MPSSLRSPQNLNAIRSTAAAGCALIAAALATYIGAFDFPLVFDDGIVAAPFRSGLAHRTLVHASFLLTNLAGLNVPLLRLENVLLHAATALALFAFCRNLLGLRQPAIGGARREMVAFAAAALFALHPVTVYAVGYLAQRTILMATLFSVLSLNAWLIGLTTKRRRWFVLSVVLYGLAVLCKEHAVMLPALAAALTIMMKGDDVREIRVTVAAAFAGGAAIVVLAVLGAGVTLGTAYELQVAPGADLLWRSVLTQALLFFRYGLIWVLPLPAWMSVDLRWPLVPSLDVAGIAALIAFVAYGAVAVKWLFCCRRCAIVGFAMLWPWLLYFTEFAVVRAQEPFVLYRSYLWAPGLVILAALALSEPPMRRLAWSAIALCLAFTLVMRERLSTFASELALWDDAVRKLPADPGPFAVRALNNRGLALLEAAHRGEALRDFDAAVKLNPAAPDARINRAVTLAAIGHVDRAKDDLDTVIASHPGHAVALMNRGFLNLSLGRIADARADLKRACHAGLRAVCNTS